jgi:hypothetical protein
VCDPRRNALLKEGNNSDRIDAQNLAELLYLNKLQAVYRDFRKVARTPNATCIELFAPKVSPSRTPSPSGR